MAKRRRKPAPKLKLRHDSHFPSLDDALLAVSRWSEELDAPGKWAAFVASSRFSVRAQLAHRANWLRAGKLTKLVKRDIQTRDDDDLRVYLFTAAGGESMPLEMALARRGLQ